MHRRADLDEGGIATIGLAGSYSETEQLARAGEGFAFELSRLVTLRKA